MGHGHGGYFFNHWPQFFFFLLLIVGFVTGIASPSAAVSYVVVLVSGMIAGKLIYDRGHKPREAYYLMLTGLLIGFVLGVPYGNRLVIIVLFLFGAYISHYGHEHGYVKDWPYQ